MASSNVIKIKNDRYSLDFPQIGQGSFGIVYCGRDNDTEERIAAKMVQYKGQTETLNEENDLFKKNKKEGEILHQLNGHRNIVKLLDCFHGDSCHWFIMEFCELGDLPQYMTTQDVNCDAKMQIMVDTSSGLSFMHSMKPPVIHRDIKPGNVLMKLEGNKHVAKISDFGTGKLFEAGTDHFTMSTSTGTPVYLAPEFFIDSKCVRYQPGVDTFALGLLFSVVLLYDRQQQDYMNPFSVESKKSGKLVTPYGREMMNAHKNKVPMPQLFEKKGESDLCVQQVQEIITQMTQFHEKDRPRLHEVQTQITQIYNQSQLQSEVKKEHNPNPVQIETGYKQALKDLFAAMPDMIPRSIIKLLKKTKKIRRRSYSKELLDDHEFEKLKDISQNQDVSSVQELILVLAGKSKHEMEEILKILTEDGQTEVVELIRQTAAKYDKTTIYVQQPGAQLGGGASLYQERYPFGGSGQTDRSRFQYQALVEPEREYQPHPKKMYKSQITVQAPASFNPTPVKLLSKPVATAMLPKPFNDTHVFENVDTHAVEVSKEEHTSFRDLVWHLIYARDIQKQLEKARAIFLWLCSKDISRLNFNNVEKGSPEEILLNLRYSKTSYAAVFETLCSYAGLHCKTISGYTKGAEYKPGMKFTGKQGQHSWNAVLVDGAWRLIDCHWAARRLVGKQLTVTPENVRYELDEYYFMADPRQHIFTHFPDDTYWQLLEKSISLSDFENLVPVKSAFFKYGLQIMSHMEAVIRSSREVTIRVGCPSSKAASLAFTFTLTMDDGEEEFKGTKLKRFGMHEMVDNVAFFTIRPPQKDPHRLIIYAKDLAQMSKEGVYKGVCEYELECTTAPPHPQPFPPCVNNSWGPGDSAAKYKLQPLQKGAIFSTKQGQAEVRFQIAKQYKFTAKLKHNDMDDKFLQGFIMYRLVNDVAIFTIYAPEQGEYGLEIYAKEPDVDGNTLFHVYQCLVICAESVGQVEPLPLIGPGYLGQQANYTNLGLTTMTHTDPFIQVESGDLTVSFKLTQTLRMTSQLIYVSKGRSDECSDNILQQGKPNEVIFQLKLPKVGLYKFQIYGLSYADSSESLPGVYNYLISCSHTYSKPTAFPKQYSQWKEGCYLYSPQEGHLSAAIPHPKSGGSSHENLHYKLDVPTANSVAVVVGEDWTQLEQGLPGGPWEGDVPMGTHWGKESKAAVLANYGAVKASYSTLLEFTM